MKFRPLKKSDQKNVEKALQLLIELIILHQNKIEPSLWMGAMVAALAENCESSEVPFEDFKKEMIKCIDHYNY